jgi:hypothetical protein
VRGRGRTGEVIDLIDFQHDWLNYIVNYELEMRVTDPLGDVFLAPGE